MTTKNNDYRALFAPTGKLRASINLGNPILARTDASGDIFGVSVDLANALAHRLELDLVLVPFNTARDSVNAIESAQADIGFFAIDPVRGTHIAFTNAYLEIEGAYLVKDASHITQQDQVDKPGQRVAVGKGSAYDLYLSRELKHADIVRAPSSPAVVTDFLAQNLDVAAGVKQQLQIDAQRLGGLRLLDGHFMLIRQAMGLAKDRGEAAATYLHDFVESMKASEFVAQALQRHGIEGVSVAALAQ